HGKVVAPERARMHYTPVHARKCFLVNVAPRDDGAAWHVTSAQTLRDRDDVRLQIPMLKTKHLAGASEPRLHFVINEQCSEFAAKLLAPHKEIRFRRLAAFALNGLDNKRRHIATTQLPV